MKAGLCGSENLGWGVMWCLNPDTVFRKTVILPALLQLRKPLSCFNCFSRWTQIPSYRIKCHCYLLPWRVSIEKSLVPSVSLIRGSDIVLLEKKKSKQCTVLLLPLNTLLNCVLLKEFQHDTLLLIMAPYVQTNTVMWTSNPVSGWVTERLLLLLCHWICLRMIFWLSIYM